VWQQTALTFDETLNVAASTPMQSMSKAATGQRPLIIERNAMTLRIEDYALIGD